MIISSLTEAKAILDSNKNLIIPTETVYGIAGNIYDKESIENIYKIKNRPFTNPLIVHIDSIQAMEKVALDIPNAAYELANKFWPGPMTLLLKKRKDVPDLVTANKPTVAVRIPNHQTTNSLLSMLDYPLAAPSANPFGQLSPTSMAHAYRYFGQEIDILDGGKCTLGIESTIIGFDGDQPVVYRLGALTLEEIHNISGLSPKRKESESSDNSSPDASGMMYNHYAPQTRLIFTDDIFTEIEKNRDKKLGLLMSKTIYNDREKSTIIVINNNSNSKLAAQNLYTDLSYMDTLNLDVIIAEKWEEKGLGMSINDRLQKASSNC